MSTHTYETNVMKKKSDVLTLDEYLDDIADHPRWRYKRYRRPDSLHRALNRIGARSQGANQFLRSDYDEVTGLNTASTGVNGGH